MPYAKFDDDFPFEMSSRELPLEARWLYVVLRCSKRGNIAGLFPTTYKDLANEADIPIEAVRPALERLADGDPMIYFEERGRRLFIFVLHQLEIEARNLRTDFNGAVKDKRIKAVQSLYAEHPTWPFWPEFFAFYPICKPLDYEPDKPQAPSEPLASPIDAPYKPPPKPLRISDSDSDSDSDSNKNKKKTIISGAPSLALDDGEMTGLQKALSILSPKRTAKPTKAEITVWERLRKADEMHSKGPYTPDFITDVLTWAVADGFWAKNVLAFAPLTNRKPAGDVRKFDKLVASYTRQRQEEDETYRREMAKLGCAPRAQGEM